MKKFLVFLCATLLIFSMVHSASASTVLDQVSPYGNASFNAGALGSNWQQEVTVGKGRLLSFVDLYILNEGFIDFYINIGSPWQDAPHEFSIEKYMTGSEWVSIDVNLASPELAAGDTFVIGIKGIDNGALLGGSIPGVYDRGLLFREDLGPGTFGGDISFRTHMDPAPEPATMLLLGSGLIGLAGARRKLKK